MTRASSGGTISCVGIRGTARGRANYVDMAAFVVTATSAIALVVLSLHQAYSFTRGRPVKQSDLFYGCKESEDDRCLTTPVPAADYDASRPPRCETHNLPMDHPMVKTRGR